MQPALSNIEHLHPKTQTCSPCQCRSPSLWATDGAYEETQTNEEVKTNIWAELKCSTWKWTYTKNSKKLLTPFVDRATKCLATAADCGNVNMITKGQGLIKGQMLLLFKKKGCSHLWHVEGTMLWLTQHWWWSLGLWKSLRETRIRQWASMNTKSYVNI